MHKGSVGKFQVWHVGKMAYEVRFDGVVIMTARNLSTAFRIAGQLHEGHRQ